MKEIDDKMVEAALLNLKKMRKFRPFFVILGVMMFVMAGVCGRLLYQLFQDPFLQGTSVLVVALVVLIINFYTLLLMGFYMLSLVFIRSNKDIILERLAEQYLKDRSGQKK